MFLDQAGEVLYVGKAKNLRKRVSSYFTKGNNLGPKTQILVSKIDKVRTVRADSELESFLLEANLIKKYFPRYNSRLTDGKSYPYIKITKEAAPKVLFTRRETDKESTYFGPFPNAGDLKVVLKLIRRVFPYQSVQNHPNKFCLYNHIGLCPCPPMFKSDEEFKKYKKNIGYLIKFFKGETKKIIKDLEKDRELLSKEERFEEAGLVQKQIDSIKLITSPRNTPFEYEINPNLRHDLRSKETDELLEALKKGGVNIDSVERIECYDISNITGKHATGSMVTFINGERASNYYRRFQIKRPPRVVPNDYAMMQEVIKRRFGHPEWGRPDLLLIDGGKGQVSSVNKALFEIGEEVPVIGIAKREETIITSDLKEIKLPKSSKALHLITRIRDEAHRFAITYHRKLRAKYFLSS